MFGPVLYSSLSQEDADKARKNKQPHVSEVSEKTLMKGWLPWEGRGRRFRAQHGQTRNFQGDLQLAVP